MQTGLKRPLDLPIQQPGGRAKSRRCSRPRLSWQPGLSFVRRAFRPAWHGSSAPGPFAAGRDCRLGGRSPAIHWGGLAASSKSVSSSHQAVTSARHCVPVSQARTWERARWRCPLAHLLTFRPALWRIQWLAGALLQGELCAVPRKAESLCGLWIWPRPSIASSATRKNLQPVPAVFTRVTCAATARRNWPGCLPRRSIACIHTDACPHANTARLWRVFL